MTRRIVSFPESTLSVIDSACDWMAASVRVAGLQVCNGGPGRFLRSQPDKAFSHFSFLPPLLTMAVSLVPISHINPRTLPDMSDASQPLSSSRLILERRKAYSCSCALCSVPCTV
jgi:hypothetical protein